MKHWAHLPAANLAAPWAAALLAIVMLATAGASWGQCKSVEVAVSAMDFGRMDPLESNTCDGAGRLWVRCQVSEDSAISYQISIDGGTSGDPLRRTLVGPGGELEYGLFLDPARTIPWGDEASGESLDGALGSGEGDRQHTIYGRISGHSRIPPGIYTDQLTITVFF